MFEGDSQSRCWVHATCENAHVKFPNWHVGVKMRKSYIYETPCVLGSMRRGEQARWKECLWNLLHQHDWWSDLLDIRHFIFIFALGSYLWSYTFFAAKNQFNNINSLLPHIFIMGDSNKEVSQDTNLKDWEAINMLNN